MKQAYVTLLSSRDYLPAVIILNRNLKELKCENPLVVLVTEEIINSVQNYLEQEKIQYKVIPIITYHSGVKEYFPNTPSVWRTASKINLFNLKEFDKLVYIDADSYFLKSINELFDYPDGAIYEDCLNGDRGFSGMFVCCPKNHNFNYYKTLLTQYCVLDGDLIATLFFPYQTNKDYHIPSKYFITIMYDNFDNLGTPRDNIYGVHFCYAPKPWLYSNFQEYLPAISQLITNLGVVRTELLKIYFEHYVQPLKRDYPELFK